MLSHVDTWLREWDGGNSILLICKNGRIQAWRAQGPAVEREYVAEPGQGVLGVLQIVDHALRDEMVAPTTPVNDAPETLRTGAEGFSNV